MLEFLQALVGFPVVLYTAPAALVLLYWMFVIVGAVDIDMVESAGGAADGAIDGAVDGVVDGAVDGAIDGAVDGAADGAADGGLAEVFAWLRLRNAPATVVFSVFVFWGFVLTFLGAVYGGKLVAGVLPEWIFSTLVFLVASVASLPLTSFSIRPLAPIFVHVAKRGHAALVGKTVVVRTTKVNADMGQAIFEDGAAGLVLSVRCDDGNGALLRGDEALIIGHDEAKDIYYVEPMRRLLAEKTKANVVPDLIDDDKNREGAVVKKKSV